MTDDDKTKAIQLILDGHHERIETLETAIAELAAELKIVSTAVKNLLSKS